MFTHRPEFNDLFKEIKRVQLNERRYYDVGTDVVYPSVTSILSFVNGPKFAAWRARVGEEEANRVKKHSTNRGTKLHTLFEYFLNNEDYQSRPEYEVPLVNLMFKYAKSHLEKHVDNIFEQETQMYSDRLCLAGTVDLIAEWDGELAVIDFKTSAKAKPEEWLEDYFVQLSAYWAMFSEKTGVVPKKLVVFLVGENGDVQIVERRNIMDYLKILKDYASQFAEYHNA